MAAKILVLEDSEENYFLIQQALEGHYELIWAKTVAEATHVYKNNKTLDLAVVDIGLPDGDGFQFCQWLRNAEGNVTIPIVFISANSSVERRITGFLIGGDDFISRPFNMVELKARIDAKLKRASQPMNAAVTIGDITIDLRSQTATVLENGVKSNLDLTPIEFKILNFLMSEPDKVFGRDELLDKVWGKDIYVYPRSVDTHMSKLRKKLNLKSDIIRSIHGIGYKFMSSVL